jgi:bifunctional DNA-binding transcriptional regulator/antitoxin component of YhaV-PrlF toxin-antitoxin module
MIQSIQKVIKIGTSGGVTIPAKELKRAGIKPGDIVEFSIHAISKPDPHTVEVVDLTQKLIARHQRALENLSQR